MKTTITCTLFFAAFLISNLTEAQLALSGGAAYGYASKFEFSESSSRSGESSGQYFSVHGELTYNDLIVGRLQYIGLQSLSDQEDAAFIENGRSFTGALGAQLSIGDSPFKIALMASGGYGEVTTSDFGREGGYQVGGLISPRYYINEVISIFADAQILNGISGSKISQTGFSIGGRITIK